MKIKITHGPEEQEKAEEVFQAVQRLLPRSRRHETEKDGRRVLYLSLIHIFKEKIYIESTFP